MSEEWHRLLDEADLPDDGKFAAVVGGWYVLLARTEQGLFAVNDRCTHQASQLSPGRIRRGAIMCPLHGARFDLATGKCAGGQYPPLRSFAVRIADGEIQVAVPATPPGLLETPAGV